MLSRAVAQTVNVARCRTLIEELAPAGSKCGGSGSRTKGCLARRIRIASRRIRTRVAGR